MTFDASRYLIKVQGGRDYLPVAWRIVWMHTDQPNASITTDLVSITDTEAIVRAVITIPIETGGVRSYSGYGREMNDGKFPYVEKAETSALGRALAHAGFGTQFTDMADEQVVDAPQQRRAPQVPTPSARKATSSNTAAPIPEPEEAYRIITERIERAELRDFGGIKLDMSSWGLADDIEMQAKFNARYHAVKHGTGLAAVK